MSFHQSGGGGGVGAGGGFNPQTLSLQQQQAFYAQLANHQQQQQQQQFTTIPPHLLQSGGMQAFQRQQQHQQQQQGGGWPLMDTGANMGGGSLNPQALQQQGLQQQSSYGLSSSSAQQQAQYAKAMQMNAFPQFNGSVGVGTPTGSSSSNAGGGSGSSHRGGAGGMGGGLGGASPSYMHSPSPVQQQQQMNAYGVGVGGNNPVASSSNLTNLSLGGVSGAMPPSAMLPPSSTDSPRLSSKRKHRQSTGGPGGASASPGLSHTSMPAQTGGGGTNSPSPAQQMRNNPALFNNAGMGGIDPSQLANGFAQQQGSVMGAGGGAGGSGGAAQFFLQHQQQQQQLKLQQQHQQQQAVLQAQSASYNQQQQQLQQQLQQQQPGGGQLSYHLGQLNGASNQGLVLPSNLKQQGGGGGAGGLQQQQLPPQQQQQLQQQSARARLGTISLPAGIPPPNPSLRPFLHAPLPDQVRPYANNPAALQLIFRNQPDMALTIAKMMFNSQRTEEGIPGLPGSSRDARGNPAPNLNVPPGMGPGPLLQQLQQQQQQQQGGMSNIPLQQQQAATAARKSSNSVPLGGSNPPQQQQTSMTASPASSLNPTVAAGMHPSPAARAAHLQQQQLQQHQQAQQQQQQAGYGLHPSLASGGAIPPRVPSAAGSAVGVANKVSTLPVGAGGPLPPGSLAVPSPGSVLAPSGAGGPPGASSRPPGPAEVPEWLGAMPRAKAIVIKDGSEKKPPLLAAVPPGATIEPLEPSSLELTDLTFNGALPVMTEQEIAEVVRWLEKDAAYVEDVAEQKKRIDGLLEGLKEREGGPKWWESDTTEDPSRRRKKSISTEPFQLIFPAERRAEREAKRRRKEARFSRTQVKAMADKEEHLVPIRVEIDNDLFKFRDTFTWNISDNVITPDAFAQTLLDDFHLPPNFRTKIVAAINDQIAEYQNLLSVSTRSSLGSSVVDAPRGILGEKDAAWWRRERAMLNKLAEASPSKLAVKAARAVANCKGRAAVEDSEEEDDAVGVLELKDDGEEKADDERPMTVAELGTQLGEYGFEEMRVVIKLDVSVGQINLVDSFEWDVAGPATAPEQFAEVYAADLGLAGEFKTAIAHDIREQSLAYLKSLVLAGHPFDGTAILDDELRMAFLPPVTDVIRPEEAASGAFTPTLHELDYHLEKKMELEREKELRRRKRQTKGRRGFQLPDREPNKTKRTVPCLGNRGSLDANGLPIPAPGAPGSAPARPPTPPPAAPPGHSRRAAALAASARNAEIAKEDYVEDFELRRSSSPPIRNERLASSFPSGPLSSVSISQQAGTPSGPQRQGSGRGNFQPATGPTTLSPAAPYAPSTLPLPSQQQRPMQYGAPGIPFPGQQQQTGYPQQQQQQQSQSGGGQLSNPNQYGPGSSGTDTFSGQQPQFIHPSLQLQQQQQQQQQQATRLGQQPQNFPGMFSPQHMQQQQQNQTLAPSGQQQFRNGFNPQQLQQRQQQPSRSPNEQVAQVQQQQQQQLAASTPLSSAAASVGGASYAGTPSGNSQPPVKRGRGRPPKVPRAEIDEGNGHEAKEEEVDEEDDDDDDDDDGGDDDGDFTPGRSGSKSSSAKRGRGRSSLTRSTRSSTQEAAPNKTISRSPKAASTKIAATTSTNGGGGNGSGAPSTREGSPLSFHDVASPESLSSLSATPGSTTRDLPVAASSTAGQSSSPTKPTEASSAASRSPREGSVNALGVPSSDAAGAPAGTWTSTSPSFGSVPVTPPQWMDVALDELRVNYPDDRIQITQKGRKPGMPAPPEPEWKLKCLDCPGRVYDTGPGPQFVNFMVHLKNKAHRSNVNGRIEREKATAAA